MFGTKNSKTNRLQKDHRVQNKGTEYKIFSLKYANRNIKGNVSFFAFFAVSKEVSK